MRFSSRRPGVGRTAGTPYAEVYDPAGPNWTNITDPTYTNARRYSTITTMLTGTAALVVGGRDTVNNGERPVAGAEYIDGAGWHATDDAQGTVSIDHGESAGDGPTLVHRHLQYYYTNNLKEITSYPSPLFCSIAP